LAVLGRVLLFAGLWLVIAGSDPASWIIGVPAVLLATVYAARLAQTGRGGVSVAGALAFMPYFLWQSLLGGLDVAVRVLRPVMRIRPGFQQYRVRLQNLNARVFFLDSISLLPGTLSADMRAGVIEVHALDASADLAPELADLERRVARLFGETLTAPAERAIDD
jgi:multicomponent Na+:H+ antiporter subunit E